MSSSSNRSSTSESEEKNVLTHIAKQEKIHKSSKKRKLQIAQPCPYPLLILSHYFQINSKKLIFGYQNYGLDFEISLIIAMESGKAIFIQLNESGIGNYFLHLKQCLRFFEDENITKKKISLECENNIYFECLQREQQKKIILCDSQREVKLLFDVFDIRKLILIERALRHLILRYLDNVHMLKNMYINYLEMCEKNNTFTISPSSFDVLTHTNTTFDAHFCYYLFPYFFSPQKVERDLKLKNFKSD
jgi:hypothetical protein